MQHLRLRPASNVVIGTSTTPHPRSGLFYHNSDCLTVFHVFDNTGAANPLLNRRQSAGTDLDCRVRNLCTTALRTIRGAPLKYLN